MFSIITPSFNRVDAIRRAIGSVVGQSGVQREHIVQDACSTDGTVEFLNEYLAQQPTTDNYQLTFASEADEGMYDAINRGWGIASGEILSWLNCDEQYLPGTLKHVSQIFKQHPDVGLVYGNAIIVDSDGAPVAARKELPLNHFYVSNSFLNIFSCTCFFRRTLWDCGLLRLNERYRYAADMDLILRLLSVGVRSYHLNDYLSLFQADGTNLSTHEGMAKETMEIRKQYGSRSPFVWHAVRLLRRAQRLMKGHYIPQRVSYLYAEDATPHYKRVNGRCGGWFAF